MKNKKAQKEVIIYQAKDGAIELKGDFKHENIWATQTQMASVFSVNSQAITKHLKNIYKEGELDQKATCSKMEQVQKEGGRIVKRSVEIYNLDAIISVGYRINSTMGTKFRKWATKTLREHIVKGYTINKKQIAKNYEAFMQTVASIQNLLPEHIALDPKLVLELIKEFASTWVALDAYDSEKIKL